MGDLLPCQLVSELNLPDFWSKKKTYLQRFFFWGLKVVGSWIDSGKPIPALPKTTQLTSRLMNKFREAYPSIAENQAANHQFTIWPNISKVVNDTIWTNAVLNVLFCSRELVCLLFETSQVIPPIFCERKKTHQSRNPHGPRVAFIGWPGYPEKG